MTRQRDALSQARRELPMVKVEKEYAFEGPNSPMTLRDLFGPHHSSSSITLGIYVRRPCGGSVQAHLGGWSTSVGKSSATEETSLLQRLTEWRWRAVAGRGDTGDAARAPRDACC
jgi:hypothetical protein